MNKGILKTTAIFALAVLIGRAAAEASPKETVLKKIMRPGRVYLAAYNNSIFTVAEFRENGCGAAPLNVYILSENGSVISRPTGDSMAAALNEVARLPGDVSVIERGAIRKCRLFREVVNQQVQMYYIDKNEWPADDLSDIGADPAYFPDGIPKCPVVDAKYALDPDTHEVLDPLAGRGVSSADLASDFRNLKAADLDSLLRGYPYTSLLRMRKNEILAVTPAAALSGYGAPALFLFDGRGAFKKRVSNRATTKVYTDIYFHCGEPVDTGCNGNNVDACAPYIACRENLKSLATTIELGSVATSVPYADMTDKDICKAMGKNDGCGAADVEASIGDACLAPGGGPWKLKTGFALKGQSFTLKGLSKAKPACAVCADTNVAAPEMFSGCSKAFRCK